MGVKSKVEGGEIIQVQGGHIIRSTGRKDRHSKVFTAKGARDRRVRLAAHTAIQFYDVQDRLGFDRPSKAVDWLINKAKASIDKLALLPPWDPTNTNTITKATIARDIANNDHCQNIIDDNNDNVGSSKEMSLRGDNSLGVSQFYVPQFLESQTFIPSNSLTFQNYPHELVSKVSSNQTNQDLCLSLHTLQDPGQGGSSHDPGLFNGFEGGWAQQQDIGRFTRLMGWASDSNGVREGLLLNQQGLTMTSYLQNERSTLQSSYSPVARPFEDNHNHSNSSHHGSISSVGYGSEGFMGLYIQSQMHGDLNGVTSSLSNRASPSSLSDSSNLR